MVSSKIICVFYLICLAAVCRGYSIETTNKTEEQSFGPFGIDSRISGGTVATIGDVPSQVSIQYRELHICGGALIKESYVLTAASCLLSTHNTLLDPALLRVMAGGVLLGEYPTNIPEDDPLFEDRRQYVSVSRIYIHSNFHTKKRTNNIALIRLSAPFGLTSTEEYTFVALAKLQTTSVPDGLPCQISGWGGTTQTQPNPTNNLQTAKVFVGVHDTCRKFFPEVNDDMVCAGITRNTGTRHCDGDIGGPLFCNNELVGIASNGTCAAAEALGIYTEIRSYSVWIEDTLKRTDNGNLFDEKFNSAVSTTGSLLVFALLPVILVLFK